MADGAHAGRSLLACSICALAPSSSGSGAWSAASPSRDAIDRCTLRCWIIAFSSEIRCLQSFTCKQADLSTCGGSSKHCYVIVLLCS